MPQYILTFSGRKDERIDGFETTIEADSKAQASDIALVRWRALRDDKKRYLKPKVRLVKGDAPPPQKEPELAESKPELAESKPELAEQSASIEVAKQEAEPLEEVLELQTFAAQLFELNGKIQGLFPGETLRLEGVQEDVYHASHGMGSTALKHFIDAPAKYQAYVKGELKFGSSAMQIGSAAHCLILEPATYDARYQPLPDDIRARRGKDYERLLEHNPGVIFLTHGDHDTVLKLCASVITTYGELFDGAATEVSYWKRDARTGIILKSRVDCERGDLIIDLKTTKSSKPSEFARSAASYGYNFQQALYCDVTAHKDFIFCVVETTAPYIPTLNRFSDTDAQLSREIYRNALTDLKACMKANEWPGYGPIDHIHEIQLPAWKRHELGDPI